MKKCPKCNTTKSSQEFYVDQKRRDGLCPYCKECKKSLQREWRLANPDKHRLSASEWRKKNPESARESARRYRYKNKSPYRPPYPPKAFLTLCKIWGEKCLACGSEDQLTIDHIVPLSRGGGSELDNLQILCRSCNCSKQDREIDFRSKWS